MSRQAENIVLCLWTPVHRVCVLMSIPVFLQNRPWRTVSALGWHGCAREMCQMGRANKENTVKGQKKVGATRLRGVAGRKTGVGGKLPTV